MPDSRHADRRWPIAEPWLTGDQARCDRSTAGEGEGDTDRTAWGTRRKETQDDAQHGPWPRWIVSLADRYSSLLPCVFLCSVPRYFRLPWLVVRCLRWPIKKPPGLFGSGGCGRTRWGARRYVRRRSEVSERYMMLSMLPGQIGFVKVSSGVGPSTWSSVPSDAFEVPGQLPVGDHPVGLRPLLTCGIEKVVVNRGAKGFIGHLAGGQAIDGFGQGRRKPGY